MNQLSIPPLQGSASKNKLTQLNEKVRLIDPLCDQERNARYSSIEARIYALDDRIKKHEQQDLTKFRTMEQELSRLQDMFAQERAQFDQTYEHLESGVGQVEKGLAFELNSAQQTCKDQYSTLAGAVIARAKELREGGQREVTKFTDGTREKLLQVQHRADQLRDIVENERVVRQETTQFLIKSFGDQILKIQDLFEDEKNQRIRGNSETMRLVEELGQEMKSQLLEEREERERCEGMFTKLLEQACSRIETVILN